MSKKKKTTQDAEDLPSFENTIHRLGEIVEQLESGELPLADSLRLFEEGVGLARASQAILDGAERRVEELLNINDRGEAIVKELELPIRDTDFDDDE